MSKTYESRWDSSLGWMSWVVMTAFTALSSYLNVRGAELIGGHRLAHGIVPVTVLVLGIFAEVVYLSSIPKAAKNSIMVALLACFGVVLAVSYLGILPVAEAWFPGIPFALQAALSAIPDVVMLAATTALLFLRARRKAVAQPAVNQPLEQVVERGEEHHEAVRESADEAPVTHPVAHPDAPREAMVTHPVEHESVPVEAPHEPLVERTPRPVEAVREAPVKRNEALSLNGDMDELARRIAAETSVSLNVTTIRAILKRAANGESQRKIGASLKGVSATTAGRVIAAAKELDGETATAEPETVTADGDLPVLTAV